MKKRIFSLLLVLVLVAGLLPAGALAAEGTEEPSTAEAQRMEAVAAPAAAASSQAEELDVTFKATAGVMRWELFAYSDKDNAAAEYVAWGNMSAKTVSLAPGDYWVKGLQKIGADTILGGLKITVDAEHTAFTLCLARLKCGNTDWTEGTDYTTTVVVNNQDNSVTREIELGVSGKNASLIALENDTVKMTVTPSVEKQAAGYEAVTAQSNPLTGLATVTATCKGPIQMTFTAPAGSEILVGHQEGYYTYAYETPASSVSDENGVSATYNLRENTTYFYRVSHPDGVTYWKFSKWETGTTVAVSAEELHLNDSTFTKSTVIRDFSSNQSDVANVLLNVNEKGYLALEQGSTYTLNVSRSWQAVESTANTETALPDMHYTVIDPETGAASDVVRIAPDANNSSIATLTAAKPGTAIVLVTYDAMSYPGAYNAVETDGVADPRFSAIWPENTGVFMVSVGSDGSAIQTNMTINEGKNNTRTEKAVGDALDSELDVLYYLVGTEGASYTFTPEAGCTVTVLHPTLSDDAMRYSGGFGADGVAVDSKTGAVTLSGLTQGKHIVKVTKGSVSAYQVITAKSMTRTMYYATSKEPVTEETVLKPGDQIIVRYSGLYDPGYKLAGLYNFNVGVSMESQTGDQFGAPGGAYGVYVVRDKLMPVTIPKYITSDTLVLSGSLQEGGYGSRLGDHRTLDYIRGVNPNFSAPRQSAKMGSLPAITLKVDYDKTMPLCRIQPMDGDTPIQDFTVLDLKDADGETVRPTGGDFRVTPGTYTFNLRAPGYLYYQNGSITVTQDGENIFRVPMTRLGANPWDGETLTEPKRDGDGTYLIGTGAELAWFMDYLTDSHNDRAVDARLTADIELAGYPFITGSVFTGTFDGAGHAIDHLYFGGAFGATKIGLFGALHGEGTGEDGVTRNGTVKNVTVNGVMDVRISGGGSMESDPAVGGIVGEVAWRSGNPNRGCTISNCVSNVDIRVYSVVDDTAKDLSIGGVAGCAEGQKRSAGTIHANAGFVRITDCVNNGDITVNSSDGNQSGRYYVGGVAGIVGVGTCLSNVANHGNINADILKTRALCDVGGVAGSAFYNNTEDVTSPTALEGLWNDGAVSAAVAGDSTPDRFSKGLCVGGVIGRVHLENSTSPRTLRGAYNQGTVSARSASGKLPLGGVIGWAVGWTTSSMDVETFEASELYTTEGAVVGVKGIPADLALSGSNDYIWEIHDSYQHADAENGFGVKLNPAVLSLTEETAQAGDKDDIKNYYSALDCIPEMALTEANRTDMARLERLLAALGETVTVSVSVYDLAAKDAGMSGASERGAILEAQSVEVLFGSTAAQTVKTVLDANHIDYVMERTDYGSYLSSVNGLAASGTGGWMLLYGEDRFDNLGLDAVKVQDGDTLALHYSVDGGTDIGAAFAGLPILTGLKLGNTAVAMSKETDWNTGVTSYYLVSGQSRTKLAGTGSQADPFVVNVTVPNGTDLSALRAEYTTCLSQSYATVTGLEEAIDFTRDVSVTLECLTGGTVYYTVKAKAASNGGAAGGDSEQITVSFRLIGATRSNGDIDMSTGGSNGSEYVTWLKTSDYTVARDATVGDVFKLALDSAGLAYKGWEKNYISAITAPVAVGGYTLAEMTNGHYSGWMYTVNGMHPEFGLNSFTVKDGDEIVWHYVNDCRYEVSDWFDGTLGNRDVWDKWLEAADVAPAVGSAGLSGAAQAEVTIEKGPDGKPVAKVELPKGASSAVAVIPTAELGSGNVLVIVKPDGSEEILKKSLVEGGNAYALVTADCTVRIVDNSRQFNDTVNHWAKDAVNFASSHALFQGTGKDRFSPDVSMSRAMLATVLYRLEDGKASGSNPFADVAAGTWYTDAVIWASAEGIVSGTGKGFEPDRNITRQELVTMLYRYAKTAGMDTGKTAGISKYADSGEVADWAAEAMAWAVANGLVQGRSATTLAPTGTATRAEVAAIMQRLVKLMVQ